MPRYTFPFEINPKLPFVQTHLGTQEMHFDESGNVDNDQDERPTNKDGYVAYGEVEGGVYWLLIRAKGYLDWQEKRAVVNNMPTEVINLVPAPPQKLSWDADNIYNADGSRYRMCFGSNFMLPQLVAEGVDIKPLLYSGLNGYRLFGSYVFIADQAGMKHWHPDNYPNWAEAVDKTFQILAAAGKGAEFSLVQDNRQFGKDAGYLRNLQNTTLEIMRQYNGLFYVLGNEVENNGVNPDDFDRPTGTGVVCSCGSGLTGGAAPLSRGKPWDIQWQHLRRDGKMFIDIPPVDAPTYWLEHKLGFDETIGFADFNDPGKRTNNDDWAYRMGREMSAWNGGTIHLHSGGHSQPLGGQEEKCKNRFVNAFTGGE